MMNQSRILIVDDEPMLTDMYTLLLEETGRFVVKAVSFGNSALQAARAFRPDLVLLDLHLPDRDGESVAGDFLRDSELRNIPLIILTGSAVQKEGVMNSRFGTLPVWAKPFDLTDFVDRVAAQAKPRGTPVHLRR